MSDTQPSSLSHADSKYICIVYALVQGGHTTSETHNLRKSSICKLMYKNQMYKRKWVNRCRLQQKNKIKPPAKTKILDDIRKHSPSSVHTLKGIIIYFPSVFSTLSQLNISVIWFLVLRSIRLEFKRTT